MKPPLWLAVVGSLAASPWAAGAGVVLPPDRTGNVFVSSFGTDEVHCYAPNGEFLFRFSHEGLDGPRGLVFTVAGELHVASQRTHRVLVFDGVGRFLRDYGSEGLRQPTSLARTIDDLIYVASYGTNSVLVYSADGVFRSSFTTEGLRGPNCIAFADTGEIYVASQGSNEVYRFEADGTAIGSFSGGGLSSPMGVAVHEGELFVTGGASHSVVVFALDGALLRTIQGSVADEALYGVQGIAFDDAGRFVVGSFYTGRVGLFARDGERLFLFEDSGMETARSVAFQPLGDELGFLRGDFQGDGAIGLVDPVAVLTHLFQAPRPDACADAADGNDDGVVNVTDAIYVLEFLFAGGPPPPPPFPEPGTDPTPDALDCAGTAEDR